MYGNSTYGDAPYGDEAPTALPPPAGVANEFDCWFLGGVMLDVGSGEFDCWLALVPVVDVGPDEALVPVVVPPRRRPFIF